MSGIIGATGSKSGVIGLPHLRFKTGGFQRNLATASGLQAITGVGFKPITGWFWAIKNAAKEMSVGWQTRADGATPATNDATAVQSYYHITSETWTMTYTKAIHLIHASGGGSYSGYVDSWDSDGFTIMWAKDGSTGGQLECGYVVAG